MSGSYRRRIVRGAALAVSTVTAITLSSLSTASATQLDNPTTRCQNGTQPTCALAIPNFPGGTISIDVDADGFGTGHWILFQHGAWRSCETDFDLVAPPQSWTCSNLPADNYVLRSSGQVTTTFHELGARW